MNKEKDLFDTKNDAKYDENTSLSVELTEKTEKEIKIKSEKHEFILSLINSIIGWLCIIIGIIIFFSKDSTIENPVISFSIFKISATQLYTSIIFTIIGLIILLIGRYKYKIKKKNRLTQFSKPTNGTTPVCGLK